MFQSVDESFVAGFLLGVIIGLGVAIVLRT